MCLLAPYMSVLFGKIAIQIFCAYVIVSHYLFKHFLFSILPLQYCFHIFQLMDAFHFLNLCVLFYKVSIAMFSISLVSSLLSSCCQPSLSSTLLKHFSSHLVDLVFSFVPCVQLISSIFSLVSIQAFQQLCLLCITFDELIVFLTMGCSFLHICMVGNFQLNAQFHLVSYILFIPMHTLGFCSC